MPTAPQVMLPVSYRRPFARRRRPLFRGLGRFGLVPANLPFTGPLQFPFPGGPVETIGGGSIMPRFLGPPTGRPCPQIIQMIPAGCTAQITYDSSGCPIRTPICPPGGGVSFPGPGPITPQQPPVISTNGTAGTPVPAGFPTNQFFVAPDGSVWEYSQTRHVWMNTGTPFNVNAPVPVSAAPAMTTVPAPGGPVSVSVAPPAVAPAPSPYQSILDFATQDTLISGLPNWVTGLGAFLAVKALMSKFGSKR